MSSEISKDTNITIDFGNILTLILVILIFIKVWGF